MNVDNFKKQYGEQYLHEFFKHDIIAETIQSINRIYIPYTLKWIIQKKPKVWRQIKEIEEGINVAVMCRDEEYLKAEVNLYYQVWRDAIVEFDRRGRRYVPF
jgi:hypothetical protein